MSDVNYPAPRAPSALGQLVEFGRQVVERITSMLQGHLNVTKAVNLRAGFATTVVNDNRISPRSNFHFSARTANAAAVQASIYYSSLGVGVATINHTNNANTDKDGVLTIIG